MKLSVYLKKIENEKPTFLKGKNPVFVTDFYDPITEVKNELIGTTITDVSNDSFTAKKGKYLLHVDVEQHEYTEDEEDDMTDEEKCSFIISSVEVSTMIQTPEKSQANTQKRDAKGKFTSSGTVQK